MPNQTGTTDTSLLSTAEAAARLGVTKQTVSRWINEGSLAHARVGSRYRIPVSEIDRLLAVQPARNSA